MSESLRPRHRRPWLRAATLVVTLAVVSGSAWLLGCSKKVDEANAGEAKAKAKEVYRLEIPKVSVAKGASSKVSITVRAEKGWKWNLEYPARVEASAKGGVEVTPPKLDKKRIKKEGKHAVWPLTVKGNSPGAGEVELKANFSICNDEQCKIFRNKVFRFPVKVE